MLHIFYQSIVTSVIFLCSHLLGSSIRARDSKKLNKVIKKAGSVLENAMEPLELVAERRMLYKRLNIMDNTSHPLHECL